MKRRYYLKHKKKLLKYRLEWQERNRDKMNEYVRRWDPTGEKRKAIHKRYYEKNRDRILIVADAWHKRNPNYRRDWRLKDRYQLNLEDYKKMLTRQKGVCSICKKPPLRGQRLYVDHDHSTNRNRDLLCHKCNSVLGLASDSLEILRSATHYLKKHRKASIQDALMRGMRRRLATA